MAEDVQAPALAETHDSLDAADFLDSPSAAMNTLRAVRVFRASDAETRELIREIIANNEKLDRVRARQQWSWLIVATVISAAGLVGGLSLAFVSHAAAGAFITVADLLMLMMIFVRGGATGVRRR